MKLRTLMLAVGLVMGLFVSIALANGNGDVTIRVNGIAPGDPDPGFNGWIKPSCGPNRIEIWISNDAPLYHLSIGLRFDNASLPFSFLTPNGALPAGGAYLEVHGGAAGAFDLGLVVDTSRLPDSLLLTGDASSHPLPVHTNSTLCYSLELLVPVGQPHHNFAVDNVVIPPEGVWMFDDGMEYAPTYNWAANSSTSNPDAPPEYFIVDDIGAISPVFTAVPDSVISINKCSAYQFDFNAIDYNVPPFPLQFFADVGEMNLTTGLYTLLPGPSCSATVVTATVKNSACATDKFTFTVNWIDSPPIFTNCPIVTGYVDTSQVYEYPFTTYDPDPCDTITYSLIAHGNPYGTYSIDPNGKFTYVPVVDDFERFFVFDVIAQSGCGSIDSCQARLAVLRSNCGDANGDMETDIGDVVQLIDYIFQGGLPPNPPSNGDVDCSGSVDISDVVYIIQFIFAFGDPLCQCDK